MKPIPFRVNPAFVTLGDALELSFAHLRGNVTLWLAPTVIYTLVAGALTWSLTESMGAWFRSTGGYGPDATAQIGQVLLRNLPGLIGYGLLLILGGIAIYSIAMALAVGGLPGRLMTPDRAIGGGLRTTALGILYVLVSVPVTLAFVVVGLRAGDAAIWLLLLLIPAVVVGYAYVALRLAFAMAAIFDGVGILDGLRLSWAVSRGGLVRIFGWLLAIGAISFGISIAANIVGAPFTVLPAVPVLVSTLLATAFQFFQAVVLAILYESQRMRHVYTTGAPLPGGPDRPAPHAIEPSVPGDPLMPPPPPAW